MTGDAASSAPCWRQARLTSCSTTSRRVAATSWGTMHVCRTKSSSIRLIGNLSACMKAGKEQAKVTKHCSRPTSHRLTASSKHRMPTPTHSARHTRHSPPVTICTEKATPSCNRHTTLGRHASEPKASTFPTMPDNMPTTRSGRNWRSLTPCTVTSARSCVTIWTMPLARLPLHSNGIHKTLSQNLPPTMRNWP